MLKKLFAILSLTMFVFCFYGIYIGAKPVFNGFSNEFELYFTYGSFGNNIVNVSAKEYAKFSGVKGESCITREPYSAVLKAFNAKTVFTEEIEGGINYYAFSPNIRYRASVKGKTVNIHYFFGKNYSKVGTPLIFGSY